MRKLLLASSLVFSSLAFANDAITIEEPFARAVPPGQPNSAAFMSLHNSSDADVRIISATSNVSNVTELHTHTDVDGVMQMRQIDAIDIPAGGTTELKPGGLHVMLIGLNQNLAEGDSVEVTLNFEDGTERLLEVPVKHVMPMMNHQHKH
ncbi:copper chaperone PCu(A)C [Nitrincola schmidtii]|uniref:copper chaperone PCu(A)C n=1 Tax=Nitrincola schmidtii TaxID=1730894 RepID=UPI00124DE70E|nr:copper chaperone PCu(A)C [Nitrincola schmidtii]